MPVLKLDKAVVESAMREYLSVQNPRYIDEIYEKSNLITWDREGNALLVIPEQED